MYLCYKLAFKVFKYRKNFASKPISNLSVLLSIYQLNKILSKDWFYLIKIVVAIELERCIMSICILCIIVYKFCYEQESYLVILLSVDKNMRVRFHGTVLPFGLAIFLRIEDYRKLLLDVKKVA